MGHIGDLAGQRPAFQFSSDIIGIFQFRMLTDQFIIQIPNVNFRLLLPDHLGYLHGEWLAHLGNGSVKLLLKHFRIGDIQWSHFSRLDRYLYRRICGF